MSLKGYSFFIEYLTSFEGLILIALVLATLLATVYLLRKRRIPQCGQVSQHSQVSQHDQDLGSIREFAILTSDQYWALGADLRFTFLQRLGMDQHSTLALEGIGQTRWEYANADPDKDPKWAAHRETLEQRKPFRDFTYSRIDKNGEEQFWRVSGVPMFAKDGTFTGYRGTANDVTLSVRSRENAKKSQIRFLNTLNSIAEGFALWDAEDKLVLGNDRYREIHPELQDVFQPGVSFRELAQAAADRGLYGLEGEKLEEHIALRIEQHRNPDERPFVQSLKNNRWVQIVERKTPDGGIISAWTDITELKLRERELLQAQKMEAVGQLTGGVAHDFNNLLSVVLGNLEMLETRLPSQSELRKYAERAQMAAQRGASLTERLLAFSRKQSLKPESTEIGDLVENLLELLKSSVGEAISIYCETAQDTWPATVDPHVLETALLNLALNARDAMSKGGSIKITVENAIVTPNKDQPTKIIAGEYVKLTLLDTGEGMSSEQLKQCFEPFFTTKDVGRGSGLGLSMVYGFVKQSKGMINIESELGKGTLVSLFFPKAKTCKNIEMPRVKHESPVLGTGETILLVEDDKDVRELAATMLQMLNFSIVEAETAQHALEQLQRHPEVDIILSDIVLPGSMDGIALAHKVARAYPSIRILLMSGYYKQFGEITDSELPFLILQKPFTKAELSSSISKIRYLKPMQHVNVGNAG